MFQADSSFAGQPTRTTS